MATTGATTATTQATTTGATGTTGATTTEAATGTTQATTTGATGTTQPTTTGATGTTSAASGTIPGTTASGGSSAGGTPSPTGSAPNEQCYSAKNLDFCSKVKYQTSVPTDVQQQIDQRSSQEVDGYIITEKLNGTQDADCVVAITNFICSTNFPKCVKDGKDNAPCTKIDTKLTDACPF